MPLFFPACFLSTQPSTHNSTVSTDFPLSLYVHIPWCVKKCPYCDFNSHEKDSAFDEYGYVDALLTDLDREFATCGSRPLQSIFFGGGTPSLFSAGAIRTVIDHARTLFNFDDIEITMEANPGTFEQEKFTAFREAGVNRLSIGIQSFDNAQLKRLGRIHDREQALKAIETAKQAGFENMNLDLMFGLPQQTIQQAIDDVKIACDSGTPHLSHYQLTIEPNTYFYKHSPALPEVDLLWDMQSHCQSALSENGYQQYEISAYSKPAKRCLHNVNYWQFGDYIGIGAGAHGKLSSVQEKPGGEDHLVIRRRWKYRQPQQYIEQTLAGNAVSGEQVIENREIVFEFLLNALRLREGASIDIFQQRTGLNMGELKQALKHIDPELLSIDHRQICTTEKGFLFLNEILQKLV